MTNVIAVVLGSGLLKDGSPTPVTAIRAREMAQLAREVKLDKIIASGSRAPYDVIERDTTEAAEMAAIIRQTLAQDASQPCPPILLEDQSLDTLGNAIFSARQFLSKETPGTLWIVTSPFHMERAIYLFSQVLDPAWTLKARPCEEWQHEDRQSGAPAALDRAREFFADIGPDLQAAYAKLIKRPPYTPAPSTATTADAAATNPATSTGNSSSKA